MNLGLQGLLIGFSIAAPVGPIGVLCIQQTLTRGQRFGFIAGLGAATADAFYGLIAGTGLALIAEFLVAQQSWLRLIGGLFLCYLGIRTLLSKQVVMAEVYATSPTLTHLGKVYLTTLGLTLTNPLTILSFAAVFAGLGLGEADLSLVEIILFVGSVFIGSALWWFLLSGGIGLLQSRFQPQHLRWVNRMSGVIILGFGLVALGSLLLA